MEYTKLGRTGLDVSRICLGCMSYGGGNLGNHAWSLPEEESRPFIKKALEAGINFFDTANRYSLGNSEEILGRAIKDFARRDEVVIATKVYGRMRPGPIGAGLSRKHRNYWPGLLRLRSGIIELSFSRKARTRAGFEVLPRRDRSLPLPHRHFAVYTDGIGTAFV